MREPDIPAVAAIERTVFGTDAWPRHEFARACRAFPGRSPVRGFLWVADIPRGPCFRVIGYVGVELSALGGEGDLVNLAVAPTHRRQGVGRLLVGRAVAESRRRCISLLWLRVRPSNRVARRFYRRCGFRVVGRFRGYYEDPSEPALLMAVDPTMAPGQAGAAGP